MESKSAASVSNYRSRALLPHRSEDGSAIRSLVDISLSALALSFSRSRGGVKGLPPYLVAALSLRLPPDLQPVFTMTAIHDPVYWQRACEARGWMVDLARHGGRWQQAFAERFVADAVRRFGVYPEQPLTWDYDFLRPPIDGRHKNWEAKHPGAERVRKDGKPARERFCQNAVDAGAWRGPLSPRARAHGPLANTHTRSHKLTTIPNYARPAAHRSCAFLQRTWTTASRPRPTRGGPTLSA